MIRCAFLAIALLSRLAVAPAAAQEPGAAGLNERIRQVRDTVELHRLEQEHGEARTVEDQLTAGFAALQLWRVTGERSHAERSRRHFDRAADQDPRSAWAHYGHALSLEPDIASGPGWLAADDAFGKAIGLDARSRARRALERAVKLDPELPGAAELLGRYAAATRDASAARLARTALADAAAATDAPTSLLVSLARTAREQGDYTAAAAAADRAVERADAIFAEASLELARALASTGHRSEAAAAYQDALANADDQLVRRLWDDVAFIRNEHDRARWEAAGSAEARRGALRSFWDVRGAMAGRTGAERAAEHYARLDFAWLHLRRWGEYGAAPANAYRLEKIDPLYSDRGVIYIRHGEPDHVWQTGLDDYVVWYYRDQEGGPLSYHFVRYGQPGWSKDPILVRRLPCMEPEVALHDPRLRPLTYGCSRMRIESVSAEVRSDVARALRTDTDAPRFARELPFHYDLYTFRGTGGNTELVAGIGVPLERLPDSTTALQLSLALADTASYSATRTGASVVVSESEPRTAPRLLRGQLGLSSPPAAAAAYRVTVQDSAGAGMTYGGTIELPDYRGTSLMLSDILLAAPAGTGTFRRGPHALSLAPTQVFAGGQFKIFYEIYNLPAGADYRTEISIQPARRGALARILGKGGAVALRFTEAAPEPAAAVHYQLRDVTVPLAPGEYVMRVRVESGGAHAERSRRFTVPER